MAPLLSMAMVLTSSVGGLFVPASPGGTTFSNSPGFSSSWEVVFRRRHLSKHQKLARFAASHSRVLAKASTSGPGRDGTGLFVANVSSALPLSVSSKSEPRKETIRSVVYDIGPESRPKQVAHVQSEHLANHSGHHSTDRLKIAPVYQHRVEDDDDVRLNMPVYDDDISKDAHPQIEAQDRSEISPRGVGVLVVREEPVPLTRSNRDRVAPAKSSLLTSVSGATPVPVVPTDDAELHSLEEKYGM